jgi:hypothetical protein
MTVKSKVRGEIAMPDTSLDHPGAGLCPKEIRRALMMPFQLKVNGQRREVTVDPSTPLGAENLYATRLPDSVGIGGAREYHGSAAAHRAQPTGVHAG